MINTEQMIEELEEVVKGYNKSGYLRGKNMVIKKVLLTMNDIIDLADVKAKHPEDYFQGEAMGILEAVKMMRDSLKEVSEVADD